MKFKAKCKSMVDGYGSKYFKVGHVYEFELEGIPSLMACRCTLNNITILSSSFEKYFTVESEHVDLIQEEALKAMATLKKDRENKMKTIKAVCIGNGNKDSRFSMDFEVGKVYEFNVDDYHHNYINESYSFTESLFNKYFKVGHPHADLMAKAAEIAKTDPEWWKHFEIKLLDGFWTESNSAEFSSRLEYRIKPKTIIIGKYEVPEPVREPLKDGDIYYIPSMVGKKAIEFIWVKIKTNTLHLNNGLIHLTQEAAEIHSKALLQWTMKDE